MSLRYVFSKSESEEKILQFSWVWTHVSCVCDEACCVHRRCCTKFVVKSWAGGEGLRRDLAEALRAAKLEKLAHTLENDERFMNKENYKQIERATQSM